jgi:GT2 family glycosyltransferase/glycosyltransferase involved in cell wall biosynthesis
LLHTLATHQAPRDHATGYAMTKVRALLEEGRLDAALSLLEYAHRLSPADAAISLTIGLVRLALGEARAAEPLEMLTKQSDWTDIWMALVLVRLRFEGAQRAAVELQEMLSRIAVPPSESDIELATMVSQRAGACGWCGLNNAGQVVVGTNRKSQNSLTFLLDGNEISPSEPRRLRGILELSLPRGWHRAARLDVVLRGRPLIGSPVDIDRITRVEGFVEAVSGLGAIHGWCRFPAERERVPTITIASLADPRKRRSIRGEPSHNRPMGGDEFALRYNFTMTADKLAPLGNAIRITGPHGQTLYGSPIWTWRPNESAQTTMLAVAQLFPLVGESREPRLPITAREIPTPVAEVVPPRMHSGKGISQTRSRPVDVVIPAFRGKDATLACVASVRARRDAVHRIIVVSDGSPERGLVDALSALAERGEIILHVEKINRGFPTAANIGLRLAVGHDVVLLNSDTIVTPGWLAGLRAAVHSAPDIGTATPLSNDATIFSYPRRDGSYPCPTAACAADIAALTAEVNRGEVIEVPTGHGFCLYIRAECLNETGLLREDLFAQGYGEENDFCMRARHLGWRHVAVPGVYVAHLGAASFNAARDDLMRRNLEILNRLHVGYDQMIAHWQLRDPLGESRRRIDLARLRARLSGGHTVLLVTHNREGGTRRHIAERLEVIARRGGHSILLRPEGMRIARGESATHVTRLDTGFRDEFPNLRFHMPSERKFLMSCLKACGVHEIEVHSLTGHDRSVVDLIVDLQKPLDIVVHDYSWFCARITLTAGDHRYCGEPAIAGCRDCVADNGTNFDEPISPDELVARTSRLIKVARSVITPSRDAARRIANHFGREAVVREWESPPRRFALRKIRAAGRTRPTRVCVVGAIGYEKGYNNLLQCARMVAATNMPLEFVVVGYTRDDRRLLETGVVRITGRYDDAEAIALIRAQEADLAWLPSVWPETWCYVLTQIWQAGLYVIVNDIGAQAERVRADDGGFAVPLNLPLDRLLTVFLERRPM